MRDVNVYAVVENRYGALSSPEEIFFSKEKAASYASDLADGAEFKEKSESFLVVGYAQSGPTAFEVYEYTVQGNWPLEERCDDCKGPLDDDGLCAHCFDYDDYI